MIAAAGILGLHGPNRKLADIPGAADAFWMRVQKMRAKWVKLLYHPQYVTHTRADAERAKRLGLGVIVRVMAEGEIHYEDVDAAILEFGARDGQGPVADLIECGNEPLVEGMTGWVHAFYLELVADKCLRKAHKAGLKLITPGWVSGAEPPRAYSREELEDRTVTLNERGKRALSTKLNLIMRRFDGAGFHLYGEHVLDGHEERAVRWIMALGLPLYGTEAGIAARDLVPPGNPPNPAHYEQSSGIKAKRYVDDAEKLSDVLRCLTFFIDEGGTREWLVFDKAGEFKADGIRSYAVTDDMCVVMGQRVGQLTSRAA